MPAARALATPLRARAGTCGEGARGGGAEFRLEGAKAGMQGRHVRVRARGSLGANERHGRTLATGSAVAPPSHTKTLENRRYENRTV